MRRATRDRLQELVEVSTRVFIAKGYRQTRMDEITRAMGLSPAAIYRYVESKEALFDLLIRSSVSLAPEKERVKIPVPSPRRGATLAFIRKTLERQGRLDNLEAALGTDVAKDIEAELEGIVRELYTKTSRYHTTIKLLDAASLDWPELARLWSGQWRAAVVRKLAGYLERRISRGVLQPVPDPSAWARLIIEIVAFLAMHRHYDPHPTPTDSTVAEETAVMAVVRGLTKWQTKKIREVTHVFKSKR